jgi:hypothetical protein
MPVPRRARAATSPSRRADRAPSQRAGPERATLAATFAAPPSTARSEPSWTTGTGASGEIRSTAPVDVDVEQRVAGHEDATGLQVEQVGGDVAHAASAPVG